jgi:hypothetical protein
MIVLNVMLDITVLELQIQTQMDFVLLDIIVQQDLQLKKIFQQKLDIILLQQDILLLLHVRLELITPSKLKLDALNVLQGNELNLIIMNDK